MRTAEQQNALHAIARHLLDEMKGVSKDDLDAMRAITDKWAEKAMLIGFRKTEMMVEAGYISGSLTNYRERY